jgi:hypothetical protein
MDKQGKKKKHKKGKHVTREASGRAPRQSILFHILCTMAEPQLRLLLGIMAGYSRLHAANRPDLHPLVSGMLRMGTEDMTWIDAMDRVATGAMPGTTWPRVLILASLTQSFAALALLSMDSEFMLRVLDARPLADPRPLLAAIHEELNAWLARQWAVPQLFLDGMVQRYLEGDIQ